MRFTPIVAIFTVTCIILQILVIYNNESYLSNISRRLSRAGNHTLRQTTNYRHTRLSTLMKPTQPSRNGDRRFLAIGIPTIRRDNSTYSLDMLQSMLNKTSNTELAEIVFLVFLADLTNSDWKGIMEAELRAKYSNHIASGTLQIIRAPREFYTKFLEVNDESNYIRWRRKQNYDFAYIMKYAKHLAQFYMQIEDDVIAADGYYGAIKQYIADQGNNYWVCLEFSELGFIGKLYRSEHIDKLADMFLLFSHTQPVDFTFIYFNLLMAQPDKRLRKPTLFQHMGYHSSLSNKIQGLKDRFFNFKEKELNGDNPEATIETTMAVDQDFPPSLAYSHQAGHFWSRGAPNEGDTFTIVFTKPQTLKRIVIKTGSPDYPDDRLRDGIVEASHTTIDDGQTSTCINYTSLGTFTDGRINITDVSSMLGITSCKCLQIRVTRLHTHWLIIREVAVHVVTS